MKIYVTAATVALLSSVAAQAQDTSSNGVGAVTLEPYVGVMGGYDVYDKSSEFGTNGARGKMDGGLIEGVAGVNVPLGTFFVGAEGSVSKGFKDIDWEYGARGRAGVRTKTGGLIYASAGHMWVNGDKGFPDHHDWIYGLGVEVGPKDVGMGGSDGKAGPRLRLSVDTYDFDSVRPMAGVIFAF